MAKKIELVIILSKIIRAIDDLDDETVDLIFELLDNTIQAPSAKVYLKTCLKKALGR